MQGVLFPLQLLPVCEVSIIISLDHRVPWRRPPARNSHSLNMSVGIF